MPTLEEKITALQERNIRVENDKARETSQTRKICITLLTYITVVIFFYSTGLGNPRINAIVPSLGFLLSTLTLHSIKQKRLKRKDA